MKIFYSYVHPMLCVEIPNIASHDASLRVQDSYYRVVHT